MTERKPSKRADRVGVRLALGRIRTPSTSARRIASGIRSGRPGTSRLAWLAPEAHHRVRALRAWACPCGAHARWSTATARRSLAAWLGQNPLACATLRRSMIECALMPLGCAGARDAFGRATIRACSFRGQRRSPLAGRCTPGAHVATRARARRVGRTDRTRCAACGGGRRRPRADRVRRTRRRAWRSTVRGRARPGLRGVGCRDDRERARRARTRAAFTGQRERGAARAHGFARRCTACT